MQRSKCRPARSVLVWTVVSFVGIQLGLNLFIEARHSEIYDPEYRDRLVLLEQRVSEEPERPLLLVVGSSRIATNFQPEMLPTMHTPLGEQPLTFNFSHTGAGPLLNVMEVRRLLRHGIHPKWMVVEVLPSLLGVSGQSTAAKLAAASDLPYLRPYMNSFKLCGYYIWERLHTCDKHQDACLRCCAPWLMSQVPEWDMAPLGPLGGATELQENAHDPATIRRRTDVVRSQYFAGLQQLRIGDTPDKATRELLLLCRTENIEIVLLLTPESSEFRGWYSSQTRDAIERYCATLSQDYGTAIVDARAWMPDDVFSDGHHLTSDGAAKFTLRLGLDVLQPLINGTWQAGATNRIGGMTRR